MVRSVGGRTHTSRQARWMPARRRITSAVGGRGCGYRVILRRRVGVRRAVERRAERMWSERGLGGWVLDHFLGPTWPCGGPLFAPATASGRAPRRRPLWNGKRRER
eukprot:scaffold7312_cov116-Isochrysis_galbana.AAC.1